MTAPVTPSAPAVRTTSTSGAASRSGTATSPFASMLDNALSADRPTGRGPSDRAIERRSTPDARDARAADRAADKADRTTDRTADHADRAADRAAHRAERAAAHAAHAAHRASRTTDRASDTTEGTEPGATVVDGDATVDAEATDGAEAPTATGTDTTPTGLHASVWALLMGAPVVVPGQPEVTATTDGTTAVAATGATAATGPGSLPTIATPVPTAAAAAETTTAAAAPAAAPEGTPAATLAAPAAHVQETAAAAAGFTVVRAEDLPATTPVAGLPRGGATAVPVVAAAPASVAAPTSAPAAEPHADTPAAELVGPGATAAVAPAAVAGAAPAPAGVTGTPDSGATGSPTTAVPAAGVAAAGDTQSPGTGTSSQQGTADGGAAQSSAPVVPSGSPAPAVPLVAPAGDPDGATGASAAQPVGTQVARQVAVLRGGPDGAHTMTVVLTPDTLGPVEVQVTLQKGTVDLTLRGAHEHGRAALLDALPDLRRDLEAAGLTTSRLEVDRDSGGGWLDRHGAQQQAAAQQQGFGDRGNQQDRAEGRSRPWVGSADIGSSGPTPPPNRSTSSGVDFRV